MVLITDFDDRVSQEFLRRLYLIDLCEFGDSNCVLKTIVRSVFGRIYSGKQFELRLCDRDTIMRRQIKLCCTDSNLF